MPTLINQQVTLSFGRLEIACRSGTPLTLEDAPEIFPATAASFEHVPDPIQMAHEICDTLREGCGLQGSHEHLFLLLYFNLVIEGLKSGAPLHSALLPLPKTRFTMTSQHKSITVDFGFWTGQRFIAVFIHESSIDQHRRAEEALLKVWGFDVFCLKADEFETRGLMGETGMKILEAVHLH